MKKGNYPIPFDAKGNQLHYPERTWDGAKYVEPEWRENTPFTDALTYTSYARGRSAAYFEFARTDGTTVTMFLKDMEAAIPHMVRGVIAGQFSFTKRGMNYGVQFIPPTELPS